jgi:nondiscriminating aspartyl-tRNA synthetase
VSAGIPCRKLDGTAATVVPAEIHLLLEILLWLSPHGGLAIGLERLTAQVLGLANVREAVLYPRDRYRLTP